MNEKNLFSGRAENYAKGRPTYAKALIDFLFDEIGLKADCTVADIGAGTGIFSKLLLERGCGTLCVEPNEDMRNALTENLCEFKNAVIVNGDAENTNLDTSSVDFITVAQAFHWFDIDKFLSESKRILKPGGAVILVWNTRTGCDFNTENSAVFQKHCPGFRSFSGTERDGESVSRFFNNKFSYAEFDNPIFYDRKQFIDRCLSASYSLLAGDEGYEDYLNDINALFDKYSQNGIVEVPNKSVVYWGRLTDESQNPHIDNKLILD